MKFKEKLKEKFKNVNKYDIIFIIAILIVTIIKQVIVFNVPIATNAASGADDALIVREAANIISGDWLGAYNDVTFLKE